MVAAATESMEEGEDLPQASLDDPYEKVQKELEVCKRKLENAQYLTEHSTKIADDALRREAEAQEALQESNRLLKRSLEKIEAMEQAATLAKLKVQCEQTGNELADAEAMLRERHTDTTLGSSTAKMRALHRLELRLETLRRRQESQVGRLKVLEEVAQVKEMMREAAECGDVERLSELIKVGLPINAPDGIGFTPLLYACGSGRVEAARLLLDSGSDCNYGAGTVTGLGLASKRGALDVVKLMLQRGARVAATDETGKTALHLACMGGHAEIAQELLDAKAGIHASDNKGDTPLHIACSHKLTSLARLLVDWGATITHRNGAGYTPIDVALMVKSAELVSILRGDK